MRILENYIRRRFLGIMGFCLIGVIVIFITMDMVENLNKFIDKNVPGNMVFLYYLTYIPYILVLTMPVASLLAAVFSIGSMAKNNEIVAMKSLGYSMYQLVRTLLILGVLISIFSFCISEGLVVRSNRHMAEIKREYLERESGGGPSFLRNIQIQEPPDKMITIDSFDPKSNTARKVRIEQYKNAHLIYRLDTPEMVWENGRWRVTSGYQRKFVGGMEYANPVTDTLRFPFQFRPEELLKARSKPDEMSIAELYAFIQRILRSGGEVDRWLTDFHVRIAFPLSNIIIILFSIPIVYNQRKRSMTVGFGVSLVICFIYFGMVKMGQTIGQNGGMSPFWAAWMGNVIMTAGGVLNLIKTRK